VSLIFRAGKAPVGMAGRGKVSKRMVVAAAMAGIVCGSGCAVNTKYTPKGRRATLVVSERQLTVRSGRQRTPVHGVKPGWFSCDPQARGYAVRFRQHQDGAQSMEEIASGLSWAAVFMPVMALFAVPFSLVADSRRGHAMASLVDAVNRHNDVSRCAGALRPRQ